MVIVSSIVTLPSRSTNSSLLSLYESAREFDSTWNFDEDDDDSNDDDANDDYFNGMTGMESSSHLFSSTRSSSNIPDNNKCNETSHFLIMEPEDDIDNDDTMRGKKLNNSSIFSSNDLTATSVSDNDFSCMLSSSLLSIPEYNINKAHLNNNDSYCFRKEENEEEDECHVASSNSSSDVVDYKFGTSFMRDSIKDMNQIDTICNQCFSNNKKTASTPTIPTTITNSQQCRLSEKSYQLLLSHNTTNIINDERNDNESKNDIAVDYLTNSKTNERKILQFGIVQIREYSITVGIIDNITDTVVPVADATTNDDDNDINTINQTSHVVVDPDFTLQDENKIQNNNMCIECPIELDWEYSDIEYITTVSEYESYQQRKRRFEMNNSSKSYNIIQQKTNNDSCNSLFQYNNNNVRRLNLQERRKRIALIRQITMDDVYQIEQERRQQKQIQIIIK